MLCRAFFGSLSLEFKTVDRISQKERGQEAKTGTEDYVLVDCFAQVLDSFHLIDGLIRETLGLCLLVNIDRKGCSGRRTLSMTEDSH